MATQVPVDVVIAAFPAESGAKDALAALGNAKKQGIIDIKDAAVLTKGPDQKLHITETGDRHFGGGALIGGVAGAAVGIVAGPIGWAALGGAAIGGLAARMHDGGFPDARLKEIGEGLTPGSSALIAVVEETWVNEARKVMEENATNVVVEAVRADLATQLEEAAKSAQQNPPSNT